MLVRAVVAWVVTFAIYLFLAGSFDGVEMVTGAIVAIVAMGSALSLDAVAERRFRCRPPLTAVLGPLRGLLPEAVVVGRALWAVSIGRSVPGTLRRQPFERGGENPADAGRRAAVFIGLSLAPQSFVVSEGEGTLLVHSLPPKPTSADARWPT